MRCWHGRALLLAMLYFRRDYGERCGAALRCWRLLAALLLGLLISVLWIHLSDGWMVITAPAIRAETAAGVPDWTLIVVRWCGCRAGGCR